MGGFVIESSAGQRWLVGVVCAGAFIANLDSTIVNIALPTLSEQFRISPTVASWTVLAYLLCETAFMLPMGKLADVKGPRAVYLSGFGIFLVGSLLCGTATSVPQLAVFRAVQGIGGAGIFAVMLAFIPLYLPKERRVHATGLATTAAALGVALGPPIGGWITTLAGWRWIFLVNLPFCVAAIWIARRRLPRAYPPPADRRMDVTGTAWSFGAFLLLLFGISMGRELGWTSPTILGSLVGSAVLLAAFIRQERRVPYPLLNLGLLRDRRISFGLLSFGFSLMTVGGVVFIFPFYLEEYRSLGTHQAGMILSLISLGQFIGPYTGRLSARYGIVRIGLVGLYMGLLAFLIFLSLDLVSSIAFAVLGLAVFGLSQGLGNAPNIALVMSCAPPGAPGSVSALVTLSRSLAVALGVLFFETIFCEAIPHRVSLDGTHLAAGITHVSELAPGFRSAFLFGAAISLLGIAFMMMSRERPQQEAASLQRAA